MKLTNQTKARIALAKVQGWTQVKSDDYTMNWSGPDGNRYDNCPDPFADANDDYAVLAWIRDGSRNKSYGTWDLFENIMSFTNGYDGDEGGCDWANYQIGDYARSACKALGIEVEE